MDESSPKQNLNNSQNSAGSAPPPWTNNSTADSNGIPPLAQHNQIDMTRAAIAAAGGLCLTAISVGVTALVTIALVLGLLNANLTEATSADPMGLGGSVDSLVSSLGTAFAQLMTLVMGGSINATLAGFGISGTLTITAIPLGLTAAVSVIAVVAAFTWAKLRPQSLFEHLISSGVAIVTSVVFWNSMGATSWNPTAAQELGLSVSTWSPTLLFLSILLPAGTYWLAAIAASPAVREIRAFGLLRNRGLRSAAEFGVITFVVTSAAGIIAASATLIPQVGISGLLLAFAFAGNVGSLVGAIGHLGMASMTSVTNGADITSPVSIAAFANSSWWGPLLVVLTLCLGVAYFIRIVAVRQRNQDFRYSTAVALPLLAFVAFHVIWLWWAPLNATGSLQSFLVNGSIEMGFGIAPWSPIVAVTFVAACSFGAVFLARRALLPAALSRVFSFGQPVGTSTVTPQHAANTAAMHISQNTAPHVQNPLGQPANVVQSTGSGQAVPAQTPSPRPLSKRTKRTVIAGASTLALLSVAGIAGTVAIQGINDGARGPEALVLEYANALASGNASAASELVDPNVPTDQRTLLSDDVFGAATEHITVIDTELISREEGVATVTLTYRLGGVEEAATIVLSQVDNTAAVLENWRIDTPLVGSATVGSQTYSTVQVSGTEVPLTDDDLFVDGFSSSLYMYPAIYALEGIESPYLESAEVDMRVSTSGSPEFYDVQASTTPRLEEEINAQVDALLTECLAQGVPDPEGCPFSTYAYGDISEFQWTLDERPTVSVFPNGSIDFEDGVASYSYLVTSSFLGTSDVNERDGTTDISGYGTWRVEGDQVVITLNSGW